MPAGYSGTPLIKKLGIKPEFKLHIVNPPENYEELVDGLPDSVEFVKIPTGGQIDFVHFFVKEAEELYRRLPDLKSLLTKNGMMWISWPKKASKVPTDVGDGIVRNAGLDIGLVDIKVCAIDEIWSGLKFVYRTKDR